MNYELCEHGKRIGLDDCETCSVVGLKSQLRRMLEERNEARSKLELCQKECEEQARLNGMGAEREAALRSRLDSVSAELEKERAFYKNDWHNPEDLLRINRLESRLVEQDHSASLKRSLAVAYSILNDAMAEQDYHVDVSRTAVWLASNEGVVERGATIVEDKHEHDWIEITTMQDAADSGGDMHKYVCRCGDMRVTGVVKLSPEAVAIISPESE